MEHGFKKIKSDYKKFEIYSDGVTEIVYDKIHDKIIDSYQIGDD